MPTIKEELDNLLMLRDYLLSLQREVVVGSRPHWKEHDQAAIDYNKAYGLFIERWGCKNCPPEA